MTKEILFEIINYVEAAGFPIVAVVSDLGGGNRSLHNELDISINKTWFTNPSNGHKICVFADVPHLIKLIRNHFVDDGFIINGKEICKSTVEEVLRLTKKSDVNIAYKISFENLVVKGAARQKVKLATKLFSHTVSRAILRMGTNGQLKTPNWLECSEFFKKVNDWFDCLNVKVPEIDSRDRLKAFGLALDDQVRIIDEMTNLMTTMRVKGKRNLLPFQLGVIITNNSLKILLQEIQERFQAKYLLTYRLNQDVLENFFGVLRAKGGLHDHPDTLEFKYRLRSYILGQNEGSLSEYSNTEIDDTPDFHAENLGAKYISQICSTNDYSIADDAKIDEIDFGDIVYDGLENIGGFISHKLQLNNCISADDTSNTSNTWCNQLSEGGLDQPTPELMQHLQKLELIFVTFNGDTLKCCKNYLKTLLELSTNINCNEAVKKLFFRCRMFFRIRHLNKDLSDKTISRKRKINKISQ
ncbi:hypothetical protein ABEB36_001117 [Hypothenemus hampei]